MPNRQKISFAIAAIGLSVILSLLLGALWREETPPRGLSANIGGPFSLIDHKGALRSDADFAGRPMLIFFGFTYCPDVCPTALDRVGAALDILKETAPGQYEALQPLFISVDPARDTPEAMADYLAYFHPKITGLTGTVEQINAVKRAYKVYAARAQEPDANGNYLVDHSSFFFLMDEQNKYLAHFNHTLSVEAMVETMVEKLTKKLATKLAAE